MSVKKKSIYTFRKEGANTSSIAIICSLHSSDSWKQAVLEAVCSSLSFLQ